MPRIELDGIVPEDLTFVFRGDEFTIDGDIDVEKTFDLIDVYQRAVVIDSDPNAEVADQRKVNIEMRDKLLALFQARDPELTTLPFGTIAYRHVLAEVLQSVGLQIVQVDPPKPKPEKKTVPRSRRSTTSRRS